MLKQRSALVNAPKGAKLLGGGLGTSLLTSKGVMFGTLGGPELILIFIVGLVVFGPRKLPEIGKTIGKMIGEFKRASQDFQRTVEDEVETEKLRKEISSAEYVSPAPEATPTAAPLIREAEGSVPVSKLVTSPADLSGDTFSGTDGKNLPS